MMSMREGVAVVYWQRVNIKCGDLGHQTCKTYLTMDVRPFLLPCTKKEPATVSSVNKTKKQNPLGHLFL